jgi:hypothetical protein
LVSKGQDSLIVCHILEYSGNYFESLPFLACCTLYCVQSFTFCNGVCAYLEIYNKTKHNLQFCKCVCCNLCYYIYNL